MEQNDVTTIDLPPSIESALCRDIIALGFTALTAIISENSGFGRLVEGATTVTLEDRNEAEINVAISSNIEAFKEHQEQNYNYYLMARSCLIPNG